MGILSNQFGFEIDETTVKGPRPRWRTAYPGENLYNRLDAIRSLLSAVHPFGAGAGYSGTTAGRWSKGLCLIAPAHPHPPPAIFDWMRRRLSLPMVKPVGARDDAIAFEVAPGSYELTASADGYESNTRTVVVAAGDSVWASIGLMPVAAESDSELEEEASETDSSDPTDIEPDPNSDDATEQAGTDDSLDSASGNPADTGDQSIPRDEEPSDANLPADPVSPVEDEGCSHTGSQNLLMALLGVLWMLRRSSKQDYRLS